MPPRVTASNREVGCAGFELSFDPAINEIFGAWVAGGTVCVVRQSEVLFPGSFVNEKRLTHLLALPSMVAFAIQYRQLATGSFPSLRDILLGGEPVSVKHAAAFADAAPSAVIHNCYGPTELSVLCAEYRLPRRREMWPQTSNGTVPIGDVYSHLEYTILDTDLRPCDDGELCVRGPQRFPGYLMVRVEEHVAIIFGGGLKDSRIGRHDNFSITEATASLPFRSWKESGPPLA